jgi:hypothetical protein
MTVSLPNPSSRLVRAAVAEQADLLRHRERLSAERARLSRELREVDDALVATERRIEVLAELAGSPPHPTRRDLGLAPPARGDDIPATPDAASELRGRPASELGDRPASEAGDRPASELGGRPASEDEARPVLRGPAIREAAVRALLAQPDPIDALHYRRWYELLVETGFSVAGKDPLAVFLTQLSRSPLVRKTSTPGVYEVDRQAPLRIRHRLERLQAELREVTVAAPGPIELGAVRARRHELDLAISQQERALEETLRVLGDAEDHSAASGAARATR